MSTATHPSLPRTIITCAHCGHSDQPSAFKYGRGRMFGQHPEHRYCPACYVSVDWSGHTCAVLNPDSAA